MNQQTTLMQSNLTNSPWILGKMQGDIGMFVAPGIAFLILSFTVGVSSSALGAALMLVAGAFDAGHIGVTIWRTWLHKAERQRMLAFYVSLPLIIFACSLLIQKWQVNALFIILTYAVLFHQMRQNYGIFRWYERLNGRTSIVSRRLLALLMILPVVIAHTPQIQLKGIFSQNSFLKFANLDLYLPLLYIYAVIVAATVIYEATLWSKGFREPNRLTSMAVPAILFGVVFLQESIWTAQLAAIIIAHACQYLALTWISLRRTQPEKFLQLKVGMTRFCGAAFVTILLMWFLSQPSFFLLEKGTSSLTLEHLCRALFVTISLSHYIVDGIIWRHKHWESRLVYIK